MMKAILERRSIRKYKKETVAKEKIQEVLMAGMSAPNAFATNEWEFILIRSDEGHAKLEKSQKWAKSARNADTVIIVCGDNKKEANEKLLALNGAAAIENMLIEATNQGLGSLWLEAYGDDQFVLDLQREFNIPSHLIPIGIVAVGVADQIRAPHDKFYKDKIHYESF